MDVFHEGFAMGVPVCVKYGQVGSVLAVGEVVVVVGDVDWNYNGTDR